jgi:hypothetical protein
MLGNFQQSQLRIEIEASEEDIRESLLDPTELERWLWPARLDRGLPDRLTVGTQFKTHIGPIAIAHEVEVADSQGLRLLLSEGIDGFHEWYWGDGWIQSRLEGVSLLPLNLGQTMNLLRLREFLSAKQRTSPH